MRPSRSFATAALPGAAAIALWGGYRHAVRAFRADQITPSYLPGRICTLSTDWGRLAYRHVPGSHPGPALVLVHGWGRSADPVWWQLMRQTDRTIVALDLPGHGRSELGDRFTFEMAAEAVGLAVSDAGVSKPILVGHSMGGPIALTALRAGGPSFAGFVAIATSAYWARPRHKVTVTAAPYVLAPASPIVTGAMRAESRMNPEGATQIAQDYAMRPTRRVLVDAAAELRRFDARRWRDFAIPNAVWIVTTDDGVVPPEDQRASARHFGVPVIELSSDHPAAKRAPAEVAAMIERSSVTWV